MVVKCSQKSKFGYMNSRTGASIEIIQKLSRVFQCQHLVGATTWIRFVTHDWNPSLTADNIFVIVIDSSFVEPVEEPII
jgi:hypothetical protein